MKLPFSIFSLLYVVSASAFTPEPIIVKEAVMSTKMTIVPITDSEEFYIDNQRRLLMNMIMVGAGGLTIIGFGLPFILFFLPPNPRSGSADVPAKDALGNDLFAKAYLNSKPAGDRSLVQGLRGDATYLIVKEDKTLEKYGLNAICTHLGCVVPWSEIHNKFICPCHASQYASDGGVIRGPAPLPLELAHCSVASDGKIMLSTWLEDDFRTGGKGWWN